MGEAQVRLLIASGGFPHPAHQHALRWLAHKDRDSRSRMEASNAEHMRIALSAKKAAWIAAITAIASIAITIIGIAVSIITWRFPRP